MGRMGRMSKPKNPAKPKKVAYRLITKEDHRFAGMHRILSGLIEEHHSHLKNARIALAWHAGWKADTDGRLKLGMCKLASDFDRQLHEFDFVIVLNRTFWTSMDVSDAQRKGPVVPENPDHARLATELKDARDQLAAASAELVDARNQARTTTTALAASQNQINDLQQQLARAKQPAAVVTVGGQDQGFIGWGRTDQAIEHDAEKRDMKLRFGLKNFATSRVQAKVLTTFVVSGSEVGRFERTMNFGGNQEFEVSMTQSGIRADLYGAIWTQRLKNVAMVFVTVTISAPAPVDEYTLQATIDPELGRLDILN